MHKTITVNGKTVADYINNFYDDNPFTQELGAKVISIDRGVVTVELKIEHKHTNIYQIAHGGVIMSLCDMTMGAACLSLEKKVVTIDFNINIIHSIDEDDVANVKGYVIHNGKSTIVAECEVKNKADRLCAKARGTFFVIGTIDK